MSAVTVALVSGIGSGLLGALISGFVTLRKIRRDLAAEYDKDLRTRRLEHYVRLWPTFAPLATTKTQELTAAQLASFSDGLRAWYFEEGGLYLSRSSMDVYNLLQRELGRMPPGDRIQAKDLAVIRFLASSLRTRMTEDLGTRAPPMLGARSRFYANWRRRNLYRRALRAASEGGYAGPQLDEGARSGDEARNAT